MKYISIHQRANIGDMESQNDDICDKVAAYEIGLLKLYGAVIGGRDLHHVLGYSSGDAFRQAVCRKTLPVQTFKREGFRLRFARTHDVAKWLASLDRAYPEVDQFQNESKPDNLKEEKP